MENNKLNNLAGSGVITTTTGSKPKQTIMLKEVENGWSIHLDKSGYASDEKTFIAKNIADVIEIIQGILRSDNPII